MSVNAPVDNNESKPWYKETWGWFVFAPLFIVVIACAITVSIAFYHADDVVKDEYVKTGKAYDKDFSAEQRAKSTGINAQIEFDWTDNSVRVYLNQELDFQNGESLDMQVLHPIKETLDRSYYLKKESDKVYVTSLDDQLDGRWYVQLQQKAANGTTVWKIKQEIDFNLTQSVRLQ